MSRLRHRAGRQPAAHAAGPTAAQTAALLAPTSWPCAMPSPSCMAQQPGRAGRRIGQLRSQCRQSPASLPVGLPPICCARRPDVRDGRTQAGRATCQDRRRDRRSPYPKFDLLAAAPPPAPASVDCSNLPVSINSCGDFGLGIDHGPVFHGGQNPRPYINGKEEEREQAYYAYQKAKCWAGSRTLVACAAMTCDDQQTLRGAGRCGASAAHRRRVALQQYTHGPRDLIPTCCRPSLTQLRPQAVWPRDATPVLRSCVALQGAGRRLGRGGLCRNSSPCGTQLFSGGITWRT